MVRYLFLVLVFYYNLCQSAEMIFPYQFPLNSDLEIYVKSPFYKEDTINKVSNVPIPKLNEVLPDTNKLLVEGVVKIDDRLVAIVNGNLYKVNDKINGGVLKEINLNYIEIERNNKRDRFFVNSTK